MFSNNTELGIMEQAYVKLKSQSMCKLSCFARGTMAKDNKIQICNLLKHLPRDKSPTSTDRKKKRSYRWH